MNAKPVGSFRLAASEDDYERLGLLPSKVANWEDGQRIGTEDGAYEWWYFDAHLEGGATVVVTFSTKSSATVDAPFAPSVTINLTMPDGRKIDKTLHAETEAFSASKDGCDVRIGENHFVGDLSHYHIEAAVDDVSVKIDLIGEVPSWRPRTGHMYFGQAGEEHLFAWFPAVPQGRVRVVGKVGAETFESVGVGYHDHNWGDAPMAELIHDWYWARSQIGPFTVVASYITTAEKYGYQSQIVFLLAKDGKVVADDETKVRFETDKVFTDEVTGKPTADITRYTYQDGETRYVITFEREWTILQTKFTDLLPLPERAIAKLAGVDGAYGRYTGTVRIEAFEGGHLVEQHDDPALWELMYFGHARPPAV